MDLDDLLDESNNPTPVQNRNKARQINGGATGMSPAIDADDDWGDSPVQQKPNMGKAPHMKIEESKQVTAEIEDDWGDLAGAAQPSFQHQQSMKDPAMSTPAIVKKEPAADIDDWGIITPAPPKKKKVEDIAVQSRKQEAADEEDEWGDTTSSKFQLKSESFSYYDCTTGTEPKLMKNTAPKANGTKCYPLFIGGASLQHGITEDSMCPKSCSSLRCYKCDKKVHRFVNGSWHATVDYMFVRNHNTNVAKLQDGVKYEPGFSAYACQCQFICVSEPDKEKCEELRWMCGGH